MNRLVLLFLLMLLVCQGYGQTNHATLFPYYENERWGLCDSARHIVVAPQYEHISYVNGQVFIVRKNEKYGVIDRLGKAILPTDFYRITSQSSNAYFYLIATRELAGQDEQGTVFDASGKEIVNIVRPEFVHVYGPYLVYWDRINDKLLAGYYLSCTHKLVKAQYNHVSVYPFDTTVLAIRDTTYHTMFIDSLGRPFSKPYASARYIGNGVFVGYIGERKFYLNRQGEPLGPPPSDSLEFGENAIFFKSNNKYGVTDSLFRVIVPARYDQVGIFTEGRAICKIGNKYGVIDLQGNVIIPFAFASVAYGVMTSGGTGYAVYEKENDLIFKEYSITGQLLGQQPWNENNHHDDALTPTLSGFRNRDVRSTFYEVCTGDSCGIMNYDGRMVFPRIYEEISYAGENLFRFRLNGRYGMMDSTGRVLVPNQYDYLSKVEYGKIVAAKTYIVMNMHVTSKGDKITRTPLYTYHHYREWPFATYSASKIGFDTISDAEWPGIGRKYYRTKDGKTFREAETDKNIHNYIELNKAGQQTTKLVLDPFPIYPGSPLPGEIARLFPYVESYHEILPAVATGNDNNYNVIHSTTIYGLIDTANRTILPFRYSDVAGNLRNEDQLRTPIWNNPDPANKISYLFNEGLTSIKEFNRVGFMDSTGRIVITPQYDDRQLLVGETSCFPNVFIGGLCITSRNNRVGVINTRNEVVIPFEYESICRSSDLTAFDCIKGRDGFRKFTPQGKLIREYNDLYTGFYWPASLSGVMKFDEASGNYKFVGLADEQGNRYFKE